MVHRQLFTLQKLLEQKEAELELQSKPCSQEELVELVKHPSSHPKRRGKSRKSRRRKK